MLSYHYSLFYIKGRKSRPEVFCKKSVLRNFAKFTGKHLCRSLVYNKVAGLSTSFLTGHLRWLLLKGQSDFQTKDLKRERKRDLKITAANRNSITIFYIKIMIMIFLKIMIFLDRFRQCFKFFYSFEE